LNNQQSYSTGHEFAQQVELSLDFEDFRKLARISANGKAVWMNTFFTKTCIDKNIATSIAEKNTESP
jgi:hypothetical protein